MMWKEKYKVGAELIDTQHKELFARVSKFIQAVQAPGTWESKLEQVKETMEFMQHYVVVHFHDEEVFQEEIGYPGLEKHREIHSRFKEGVFDYARRAEAEGYSEDLVQEFGGRLMAWLINHVAAEDQKIGAFLRSQGGNK
jgi:hemerythrin